jgi:hypothetical protein
VIAHWDNLQARNAILAMTASAKMKGLPVGERQPCERVRAKALGRKGIGWHPSGKFQVARLFLPPKKILRRGSQNVTSQKKLASRGQNDLQREWQRGLG